MAETTIIGSAAHVESMTVRRLMDLDDVTISSITRGDSPVYDSTTGNFLNQSKGYYDVRDYGATGNGTTDDRAAIQLAIDAARTDGGIVYMPPGTYKIANALQIWDADNITLAGAGKATIISATTATTITKVQATQGEYGVIMIAPTAAGGVALNNITLQDFALLCPATINDSAKAVYVGATNSCTLRRLYTQDSPNECLYGDPYAGLGYSSTNWVVEDCEIADCLSNGINSNASSGSVSGIRITGNYLHGCVQGINVVGNNIIVDSNRLNDCGVGIAVTPDGALTNGSIAIVDNAIWNNGLTVLGPSDQVVGINVGGRTTGTEHGLLVANNAIGPQYGGQGIVVTGNWIIRDNTISGTYALVGGEKGNYERAIWVRETGIETTQAVTVLDGNVIEALEASAGYSAGIYIESNALVLVHSSNNFVRTGAMRSGHPYGAYVDVRGVSTLDGDIFNDLFTIGATDYNTASELDNTPQYYSPSRVGTVVAAKGSVAEWGNDIVHKSVITLAMTGANDLDLADGADHGTGVKVYDFPAGRIHILGAVMDATVVVNDAFNANPNDTLVVSCGSAVGADDGTLSSTEADIIPSTTIDTSGSTGLSQFWRTALAAAAQFDGTSSALDLYVNAAVTDACTKGAVTIAITGTLTITWINLGDY